MRAFVVAVGLMASVLAHADERPWAAGVSEAQQADALALFAQGNEAYSKPDYAEAARLYREALARWDHPAIHGNLAMALVHLDAPVVAHEEIERALAYGPAPFEQTAYAQLLTSRKLLLGQLARIEVRCDEEGAAVTLDSKPILSGRGSAERYVRIGAHEVVARKPGRLTFTSHVTALPDAPQTITVVLVPLEQAGGFTQRWSTWKPWAVVAAGVAVLAVGVGLEVAARQNIDAYEQEIARSCPAGCTSASLAPAVRDLVSTGQDEHGVAIGAMSLGAAGIVTGGVLAYLNRPRRVHLDEAGRRVSVAPKLGRSTLGLAVTISY